MRTVPGLLSAFAAAIAMASTAIGGPYLGLDIQGTLRPGSVTYTVSARVEQGARIDAVFGNSDHELVIAARDGLSFYQDDFGGPTSTSINSGMFKFIPSLEQDSYVSIGARFQDGFPFDRNALTDVGIDWSTFELGGAVEVDDGSWFITPERPQGEAIDGLIFVGQFTVLGGSGVAVDDLELTLNFQGSDRAGNSWTILAATVPASGSLALLGLAGICGHRGRG